MKTLIFSRPEQFEMLYEAVIARSDGYVLPQARVAAKILDKMEALGQKKETIRGVNLYTLDTINSPKIELEDAEFDMAKMCFNQVVWTGRSVRDAVRVGDWLEGIK